ncbi:glycoside hydrolase superfamily [Paraphysoderma sedebokerense]|nr:glycoside hydrolase superfamily [Paraphysoderma sedebokerense]
MEGSVQPRTCPRDSLYTPLPLHSAHSDPTSTAPPWTCNMLHRLSLILAAPPVLLSLLASILSLPPTVASLDPSNPSPPSAIPQCPDVFGQSDGVYYGVHVQWSSDAYKSYVERLGRTPAVFSGGVEISSTIQDTDVIAAGRYVKNVAQYFTESDGSVSNVIPSLFMTVLPMQGLNSVTDASIEKLARACETLARLGTPVLLRYGPDMNGNWFPWSSQPEAFVSAFQKFYTIIKSISPSTSIIWAPAIYSPGSNMAYSQYYPGDDYVDWVGLAFYHTGNVYPPINSKAASTKLEDGLTGRFSPPAQTDNNTNSNARNVNTDPLLNFYQTFSADKNKPFVLSDTGVPYYPTLAKDSATPNLSELELKQSWWQQVYNQSTFQKFPNLKLIMWSDMTRDESFGALGDYRTVNSDNLKVRESFKRDLFTLAKANNEGERKLVFNDGKSRECYRPLATPKENVIASVGLLLAVGVVPLFAYVMLKTSKEKTI